jgi:hypothetical protein
MSMSLNTGERTTEGARAGIRRRHGAPDSTRRQTDRETGGLVAGDQRKSEAMMRKPQTFQGDLANLPPALLPLTESGSVARLALGIAHQHKR